MYYTKAHHAPTMQNSLCVLFVIPKYTQDTIVFHTPLRNCELLSSTHRIVSNDLSLIVNNPTISIPFSIATNKGYRGKLTPKAA